MQLKALVRNKARELNVPAQLVLQSYVLERLLERISCSRFKESFIVKGGFLLASVIGLDTRTTKDLDATIRNLTVSEEELRTMFEEVINIVSEDSLSFELGNTEEIREGDEYPGLRLHLVARFEQLAIPLAVDVTAGESIVPPPLARDFPRLFTEGTFSALSYQLETVAAEKIETVLARSTANTRARDFYDIFVLDRLQGTLLTPSRLHDALVATTKKRNSIAVLTGFNEAVAVLINDESLNRLWEAYVKKNSYASGIDFKSTCISVISLLERAGFVD